MSVYRRHKRTDFSVIDNHVFKDKELTLKAKGLLTTILSLPEDWKYSIEGLTSLCADGTTSVTSALNELIDRGYIIRTQSVDEGGRFNGYIYDIYEESQEPCSENPITDNAFTENSAVSNTNILNTKVLSTNNIENPLISPTEKIELLFKQFWEAYPRKDDKKRARAKFKAIKNIEQVFPDIMADVENKKKSEQWNKNGGQFIPMPSTYLNNERWNDEETVTMQNEIETKCADEFKGFF